MEFTVKKHSKEDFFPVYNKWLESHSIPLNSISIEILPNNLFVCYAGDIPIYALPFWHTDSKIAIISVIVSNGKLSYKKKLGGKEFLLDYVKRYAKKKKYLSLFAPTKNDRFIESLLKVGFTQGDDDSSQYFIKL
jgi:hypothetical protein